TVLMWPIVARATEEILRLVPQEYREGALALGVPRWRAILRVVVPTAGAGIFTAIMLAVARGLGETAPILLTSLGNDFMNTNLMHEEVRGARVEGKVVFNGEDIYAPEVDPVEIRRRIGMVFQKANPFPTMSIQDNAVAGLKLLGGFNRSELAGRAERALRQAG